jgi:hypothetical protein
MKIYVVITNFCNYGLLRVSRNYDVEVHKIMILHTSASLQLKNLRFYENFVTFY